MVTVVQYWDYGLEAMPPLIRHIYEHNLRLSKKYGFELLLLTKKNLREHIKVPLGFGGISARLQSDTVRWTYLDHGGGIWMDGDGLLLRDPTQAYEAFLQSGCEVAMVKNNSEKEESALLMGKAGTTCTRASVEYLRVRGWKMAFRTLLDAFSFLLPKRLYDWLGAHYTLDVHEIGPHLSTWLNQRYPDKVLAHAHHEFAGNFMNWRSRSREWYFDDADSALRKARAVFERDYYALTWRLSRVEPDAVGKVFGDERSVFCHLLRLSKREAGFD